MRKIVCILILVLSVSFVWGESYPPRSWNADFMDALEEAQSDDKYLLINFTGSDWCSWCHKLRDEVFDTRAFKKWAKKNAVLVFIDDPTGITLSDGQKEQNDLLRGMLAVTGYPTIWLFENDLTPLLATGYRVGGADVYIEMLETERNMIPERIGPFVEAFNKVLDQRIKPLDL